MGKFGRLKQAWSSITGRLILGVVVVHLLLTPLLFYGILLIVQQSFESQFVDQVRNNTLLYLQLLTGVIEDGSEEDQQAFLQETMISGDVLFAEYIDSNGQATRARLSGTEEPDIAFVEDFEFGEHGDQVYFIEAPLYGRDDGQPLGIFRLGYDELSVQEQINAAYGFGTIIASSYILLSMIVAIFFGRRLIQPVLSLRQLATSIAAGDTSLELRVDTGIAEFEHLANDLEHMHRSLTLTQQEIKDRELRLQAILSHAGEGIVTIDTAGIIQTFNLAAERIFGYKAEEVLGSNVSILMPSPYDKLHDEYISKYLATGVSNSIGVTRRLQALRKDGSTIPINLTLSEVQLDDGVSFTGVMHDLSEEEQKDAELQQLSRAVEQSPVSILITSKAGEIEYVNPSFCHMTGYSAEEVIGRNPRFLNSGQTEPEEYRNLWNTISNGGIWRGVFRNKAKSGKLFWFSSTVCPVQDHLGQITHFISISEDITDARKKESMLTQAMKLEAIGRMTDGISHDFNNLLTIIQGNLKFLFEDLEGGNEEHLELIEDALSAARDGTELIKRLLAFSRRQELDVQVLNINDNLAAMERLLQRSAPEINIELELDGSIGNTSVDASRFESAVFNMVTNARDAMPDGGTIRIATSQNNVSGSHTPDGLPYGSYVVLSVSDNGKGMDEETRRQAVEPFFTTKPIEAGTGLGLTMVHDFVRQCGGELQITSELNIGTTIRVFLPVSHEYEHQRLRAITEDSLPRGSETILVVEDREGVRRFACRTLQRLGYRTYDAKNADDAMGVLQNQASIDLLFSDIVMPGEINGRDLARLVARERPEISVLLTTGMDPDSTNEIADLEFIVLAKPYSAEDLAKTIRATLDA
jgi:two-component system NtrC family sensor kinase